VKVLELVIIRALILHGAVSTTSHYQGIIVDDSSKATFNDNVQMLEERLTVPLNNSAGLTVDNASEVLFNSDVTANGFWRAGIEVKNGSLANFKGVVTAQNNESPVANTSTTMDFGSTAINISDSTVTFDKQPILDNNYNAIKISGATSDVTFSTDLLFTNNKSYGINLLDVSDINFKNITYNADPASYFSTFFNSKSSKQHLMVQWNVIPDYASKLITLQMLYLMKYLLPIIFRHLVLLY
jgi:hypothetical protein